MGKGKRSQAFAPQEWVEFGLSELASCMSWRLEVRLAGEGEGKERAPLE